MNELVIQQEQGFPVRQKTFEFMQDAYSSAIQHLCKTYGENLILYGCELVGNNRTAGALVIGGELLPFEASPNNTKILISETVEEAVFQDGVSRPAYKTRTAKCSNVGENINIADLKRVVVKIAPQPTDWVTLNHIGQVEVYQPVQAKINERGVVQLRGVFSAGASMESFDLPVQFMPKFNRAVPALCSAEGNPFGETCIITNRGKILLQGGSCGSGYISFDCEYEL